jgi:hypothetical protein
MHAQLGTSTYERPKEPVHAKLDKEPVNAKLDNDEYECHDLEME